MNLWGDKTISWFDIWSVEHFVAGITIGSILYPLVYTFLKKNMGSETEQKVSLTNGITLVVVLFCAYLWETVEHYGENGATTVHALTYWFQGVEFWGNRIITDPLLVLAGAVTFIKMPSLKWPARVFSVTWLFTHVFIFPHCMYLHDLY